MTGFGSQTIGGNNGVTLWVTNLNLSGPGSLQAALLDPRPRHIKSKISGTIPFFDRIHVTSPFMTLEGPTFGLGLQFIGMITVSTHDTIITQIGFKSWDTPNGYEAGNRGCIEYADGASNFSFHHNSCFWSIDENVAVTGGAHDGTIAWNLVAECLRMSIHPDTLNGGQPHSKGIMVNHSAAGNVSVHHNLIHSNDDRNPQLHAGNCESVANVVTNWGFGCRVGNLAHANIERNIYLRGPNTPISRQAVITDTNPSPPAGTSLYVSHNIGPQRPTDSGDEWNIGQAVASAYRATAEVFTPHVVDSRTDDVIKEDVIDHAGRLVNDSAELRVRVEAETGGGSWKDTIVQAGGYPIYPVRTSNMVENLPVQV